jgi:hypothetical protein
VAVVVGRDIRNRRLLVDRRAVRFGMFHVFMAHIGSAFHTV